MKTSIKVLVGITAVVVLATACFSVYAICTINNNKMMQEFYDYQDSLQNQQAMEVTENDEPVAPKGEISVSVEEAGDAIVWLRNYIESNRIVYAQAEKIGLPCSGYTTQEDVSDNYVQILSTVDNTDVATYTFMTLHGDTWEVSTEPLQNKYGDIYPIMYFENGVPSDSCDFYEQIYEDCATPDTYSTDYVDGQMSVTITDVTIGSKQQIELGQMQSSTLETDGGAQIEPTTGVRFLDFTNSIDQSQYADICSACKDYAQQHGWAYDNFSVISIQDSYASIGGDVSMYINLNTYRVADTLEKLQEADASSGEYVYKASEFTGTEIAFDNYTLILDDSCMLDVVGTKCIKDIFEKYWHIYDYDTDARTITLRYRKDGTYAAIPDTGNGELSMKFSKDGFSMTAPGGAKWTEWSEYDSYIIGW